MEIIDSGSSELTITGEIYALDHYLMIKKAIAAKIAGHNIDSLTINIPDSPSITSAVIGLFLRLIQEKKIRLSIVARNPSLGAMLEVLRLNDIFHVVQS